MPESAAKQWRKYIKEGGTQPFTNWLTREKQKMHSANGEDNNLLMIDHALNDSVHNTINDTIAHAGTPPKKTGQTVFGINKYVFIAGVIITVAAGIYLITQHSKK